MNPPVSDIHIVPMRDVRKHRECGFECWCHPQAIMRNNVLIVIHHAADGRELVEQHGLQ